MTTKYHKRLFKFAEELADLSNRIIMEEAQRAEPEDFLLWLRVNVQIREDEEKEEDEKVDAMLRDVFASQNQDGKPKEESQAARLKRVLGMEDKNLYEVIAEAADLVESLKAIEAMQDGEPEFPEIEPLKDWRIGMLVKGKYRNSILYGSYFVVQDVIPSPVYGITDPDGVLIIRETETGCISLVAADVVMTA